MAIAVIAFGVRLFSVIRYEAVIHEFDPWFNFRATKYIAEHGWEAYYNWFDPMTWYPKGRPIGHTTYSGMMATAALLHWLINKVLAIPLEVRQVCVFLAPTFAALTTVAVYGLAKELQDGGAALVAALLMAVCPGYLSRSVAGAYDYEAIAIFQMVACFYCWVRACKRGSSIWAICAALFYFYMGSSWGGYVYVINLIPLHVLVLLISGRYSVSLYKAYSTFYIIGLVATLTVHFIWWNPIVSSEHLASRGVFCLIQIWAFINVIKRQLLPDRPEDFKQILWSLLTVGGLLSVAAVVGLSLVGVNVLGPVGGRLYSLFDSGGHARVHVPLVTSVSEHQPTPWGSFFFDLNLLLMAAPVGLFMCYRQRKIEHLFAIVYAVSGAYFAAVMVRLMLTLSPIMCVLGGMGLSRLLDIYTPGPSLVQADPLTLTGSGMGRAKSTGSSDSSAATATATGMASLSLNSRLSLDSRLTVTVPILLLLCLFVWHSTWASNTAYSSPSIMLASTDQRTGGMRIIDDFREAYYWLRRNTPREARILSWWDYGYQITGMAERTTIVDNNTNDNNHIARVGLIMASGEKEGYPLLRQLDVDYILVLAGNVNGFSGDDINKFLWMVRIAGGVFPDRVRERDFLTANGEYRVDAQGATPAMRNSLMYKMIYQGISALGPAGAFDRARQAPLHGVDPKLSILNEAYTTENHMVRIYKVKRPDLLGRSLFLSS